GRLSVEVADDGPAAAGPAGVGNGLPGMRARAAALGGGLTAGPAPDGGFVVTATLPTDGHRPDEPARDEPAPDGPAPDGLAADGGACVAGASTADEGDDR